MNQITRLQFLINYLIQENKLEIELPTEQAQLFSLYRSLVNIREAKTATDKFIMIQNKMLKNEIKRKGIIDSSNFKKSMNIWRGDITQLKVDAIVNAANNQMEGCFIPGHNCIDNAIHTFAGVQLRNECHQIMSKQRYLEPTGRAKITNAYNLPCRYIVHTVGPIVHNVLTDEKRFLLAECYRNCLKKAEVYGLKSIAFCCISTGVFNFPKKEAAQIAINTVSTFLKGSQIEKVIFNVFKEDDEMIYQQLLNNKSK